MNIFKKRTFGQWIERMGDALVNFGIAAGVLTFNDLQPSWTMAAWMLSFGFAMGIAGVVLHAAMHGEAQSQ